MTIVIKNPTPDMLDDDGKVDWDLVEPALVIDIQNMTVEAVEDVPNGYEHWANCGMCGINSYRPFVAD